jgi:hypothetical protein
MYKLAISVFILRIFKPQKATNDTSVCHITELPVRYTPTNLYQATQLPHSAVTWTLSQPKVNTPKLECDVEISLRSVSLLILVELHIVVCVDLV